MITNSKVISGYLNSLSEQTGYRAQITDAFINWNRYSFANVKIGQFKTPFGYEQLGQIPKP